MESTNVSNEVSCPSTDGISPVRLLDTNDSVFNPFRNVKSEGREPLKLFLDRPSDVSPVRELMVNGITPINNK